MIRDPFGLEPLYAHRSSTQTARSLGELRNEHETADLEALLEYILFGDVWDAEATLFRDIRRVPPGRASSRGTIESAWTVPPPHIIDRAPTEFVALLWSTLDGAVGRAADSATGDVIVALSGGLDSAAIAVQCVRRYGRERVRAITAGSRTDPETRAARATAKHLRIQHDIVEPADEIVDWPHNPVWPTLPRVASDIEWEQLTEPGLVVWGIGGDSIQRGDRGHYLERFRRRQLLEGAADIARCVFLHGCKPALGLRHALAARHEPTQVPAWVADGARAAATRIGQRRATQISSRRRGVDEMRAPAWSWFFEWMAPAHNDPPIANAFPFFDVELVEFMAGVPTAPWCVDKTLLRAALRGHIPEHVRLRPKSPVREVETRIIGQSWSDQLRDALREGSEDLINRDIAINGLYPGRHELHSVTPLLRCAAAARWRSRLGVGRLRVVDTLGEAI